MHHLQRSKFVPHIEPPPTQRWGTGKKVSLVTYAIFLFFQHRTYVPIIRQKIESLVFLFEIRSNLVKPYLVYKLKHLHNTKSIVQMPYHLYQPEMTPTFLKLYDKSVFPRFPPPIKLTAKI